MLMWSTTSYADTVAETPTQYKLSPAAAHAIALDHREKDLCFNQLAATTQALYTCQTDIHPPLSWWQTPTYAVSAPLAAALLAILISEKMH